ncbi:MAG: helix-turn-helix domain-containing protein [Salinibacterium sp.]|nr:helix-turn-helix domain-containing protein [Salinibacterium sp.]
MARTPGRQTDQQDDDSPLLQVDELTLRDVGHTLKELTEQIRGVADLIDGGDLEKAWQEAERVYQPVAFEEAEQLANDRFVRTLSGLRAFRRNYDYWERAIAEFALTKQNMTQREVARLLGVSTATINRWAQHPIVIEERK